MNISGTFPVFIYFPLSLFLLYPVICVGSEAFLTDVCQWINIDHNVRHPITISDLVTSCQQSPWYPDIDLFPSDCTVGSRQCGDPGRVGLYCSVYLEGIQAKQRERSVISHQSHLPGTSLPQHGDRYRRGLPGSMERCLVLMLRKVNVVLDGWMCGSWIPYVSPMISWGHWLCGTPAVSGAVPVSCLY